MSKNNRYNVKQDQKKRVQGVASTQLSYSNGPREILEKQDENLGEGRRSRFRNKSERAATFLNSVKYNATDQNYQMLLQLQSESKSSNKRLHNLSLIYPRNGELSHSKEGSLAHTLPHPGQATYLSNEEQYRQLFDNKNKQVGRIPNMILNMVPPNQAMAHSIPSPLPLTQRYNAPQKVDSRRSNIQPTSVQNKQKSKSQLMKEKGDQNVRSSKGTKEQIVLPIIGLKSHNQILQQSELTQTSLEQQNLKKVGSETLLPNPQHQKINQDLNAINLPQMQQNVFNNFQIRLKHNMTSTQPTEVQSPSLYAMPKDFLGSSSNLNFEKSVQSRIQQKSVISREAGTINPGNRLLQYGLDTRKELSRVISDQKRHTDEKQKSNRLFHVSPGLPLSQAQSKLQSLREPSKTPFQQEEAVRVKDYLANLQENGDLKRMSQFNSAEQILITNDYINTDISKIGRRNQNSCERQPPADSISEEDEFMTDMNKKTVEEESKQSENVSEKDVEIKTFEGKNMKTESQPPSNDYFNQDHHFRKHTDQSIYTARKIIKQTGTSSSKDGHFSALSNNQVGKRASSRNDVNHSTMSATKPNRESLITGDDSSQAPVCTIISLVQNQNQVSNFQRSKDFVKGTIKQQKLYRGSNMSRKSNNSPTESKSVLSKFTPLNRKKQQKSHIRYSRDIQGDKIIDSGTKDVSDKSQSHSQLSIEIAQKQTNDYGDLARSREYQAEQPDDEQQLRSEKPIQDIPLYCQALLVNTIDLQKEEKQAKEKNQLVESIERQVKKQPTVSNQQNVLTGKFYKRSKDGGPIFQSMQQKIQQKKIQMRLQQQAAEQDIFELGQKQFCFKVKLQEKEEAKGKKKEEEEKGRDESIEKERNEILKPGKTGTNLSNSAQQLAYYLLVQQQQLLKSRITEILTASKDIESKIDKAQQVKDLSSELYQRPNLKHTTAMDPFQASNRGRNVGLGLAQTSSSPQKNRPQDPMKPSDLKQYFVFDNISYQKPFPSQEMTDEEKRRPFQKQQLPQITKQNQDMVMSIKTAGIIGSQNDSLNSTGQGPAQFAPNKFIPSANVRQTSKIKRSKQGLATQGTKSYVPSQSPIRVQSEEQQQQQIQSFHSHVRSLQDSSDKMKGSTLNLHRFSDTQQFFNKEIMSSRRIVPVSQEKQKQKVTNMVSQQSLINSKNDSGMISVEGVINQYYKNDEKMQNLMNTQWIADNQNDINEVMEKVHHIPSKKNSDASLEGYQPGFSEVVDQLFPSWNEHDLSLDNIMHGEHQITPEAFKSIEKQIHETHENYDGKLSDEQLKLMKYVVAQTSQKSIDSKSLLLQIFNHITDQKSKTLGPAISPEIKVDSDKVPQTDFTSYLANEVMKMDKNQTEKKHFKFKSYILKQENDSRQLRQVQFDLIKELEECIGQFKKTSSALDDLKEIFKQQEQTRQQQLVAEQEQGAKQRQRKRLTGRHLFVYDQKVRQMNRQSNEKQKEQQDRTNSSAVIQYLEAKMPVEPAPTKTRVKIFHQFDAQQYFNHPVNVSLRNINFIIKLIFKNTRDALTTIQAATSIQQTSFATPAKKEQSAISIQNQEQLKNIRQRSDDETDGSAVVSTAPESALQHCLGSKQMSMQSIHDQSGAKSGQDQTNTGTHSTLINHGSQQKQNIGFSEEEIRLKQIQDIAAYMKVQIPKRFMFDQSKQAIREFIQSRAFIIQMKQSMNQLLYDTLNKSNGMIDAIKRRQESWANYQSLIQQRVELKKREKSINDPGIGVSWKIASDFANKEVPSPIKRNVKKSQLNSPIKSQVEVLLNQETNHSSIFPIIKKAEGSPKPQKQNEGDHALPKKKRHKQKRKSQSNYPVPAVVSNEQQIQLIQSQIMAQQNNFTQKFFVGPGNNFQVVKQLIKQRYWWAPAHTEDFSEANFIWTSWRREKHVDYLKQVRKKEIEKQTSTQPEWQNLKFYSRVDNNKQLTNKKGLFFNMVEYYRKLGQDPFIVLPKTYLVSSTADSEYQRFERDYQGIVSMIKERKQILEQKIKDVMNGSSGGFEDDQEQAIQKLKRKYRTPLNTWILKPGENTNRGAGINVCENLGEISSLVGSNKQTYYSGAGEKLERTTIIQKYIDYPLLINKRKFDFRVFGLVTVVNQTLKGYYYEDGYIRTSSRQFDLQNLSDKFIHLTNDAIQKQGDDFGKFENYNKMSFQDFQKYLNYNHAHLKVDVLKHIIPQIKKLIADTYRAVCFKIDPLRLRNSFEILGYDFMLDEDFKLCLIEVNTNPCLETDSPLLSRIIPELIESTFKLVLDPVFPCPDQNRKQFINQLPQEIKYQLIFDEEVEGPSLATLFGLDYEQFRNGLSQMKAPALPPNKIEDDEPEPGIKEEQAEDDEG